MIRRQVKRRKGPNVYVGNYFSRRFMFNNGVLEEKKRTKEKKDFRTKRKLKIIYPKSSKEDNTSKRKER